MHAGLIIQANSIHSSMTKPTSVRNKPAYIRSARYLICTWPIIESSHHPLNGKFLEDLVLSRSTDTLMLFLYVYLSNS